jgi:arsenate reductase
VAGGGPRPAPDGAHIPSVQVFGRRDSRATQKAIRFFRERRVAVSFVDLGQRPISRGELRRFADRLSPSALLDVRSRAYRSQGLEYMRFESDGLFERLLDEQQLLMLPLVRAGERLAVGADEVAWRAMLDHEAR